MFQKLIIPTALILCTSIGAVSAVPLVYEIKRGQTECLYDTLEEDEFMTMSVFITDGNDLRGTGYIQGPVAPKDTNSAKQLINSVAKFDRNPRSLDINEKFDIDMEHILERYGGDDDDDMDDEYYEDDDALDDIYYSIDDDDFAQFEEDDHMDDEERAEIRKYREEWEAKPTEEKDNEKAERKKEMEEARLEIQQMREERKKRKEEKQKRKMKKDDDDFDEIESIQKTHQVKMSGWYKVCVEAPYSGISVELEMRKSSELGQPSSRTGHLQSYERRAMVQEERRLFHKNTLKMNKDKGEVSDSEKGLEDKDLDLTRQQLQRLNRLLNEIREKQQNERHRLAVHAATNEHSHSRMVLSSLFETVFYMVVSGFQVYTIRKWFSGAPMLGF